MNILYGNVTLGVPIYFKDREPFVALADVDICSYNNPQQLKTRGLYPIDKTSEEYKDLAKYFASCAGKAHGANLYKLDDLCEVEGKTEFEGMFSEPLYFFALRNRWYTYLKKEMKRSKRYLLQVGFIEDSSSEIVGSPQQQQRPDQPADPNALLADAIHKFENAVYRENAIRERMKDDDVFEAATQRVADAYTAQHGDELKKNMEASLELLKMSLKEKERCAQEEFEGAQRCRVQATEAERNKLQDLRDRQKRGREELDALYDEKRKLLGDLSDLKKQKQDLEAIANRRADSLVNLGQPRPSKGPMLSNAFNTAIGVRGK